MVRSVPQPLPPPGAGSPAAYLRVYEPLEAFPAPQRAMWEAYAARAATRSHRLVAEHRMALAGVLSVPPRPVPTEEVAEAFVVEVGGVPLICPVQSRLRSWVALGQFRDRLPPELLHAFVPPAALARAEADHEQWGAHETSAALRILTATWSVPLQWFVPFSPRDRVMDLAAEVPTVVHRAGMSAARRRVARALRTVEESLGELDVLEQLTDLGRWLEEWHPRSLVELDYAGLARVAGQDVAGQAEDTSVADVAAALAALAAGDDGAAVERYSCLVERWAEVAALEHAN